MYTYSKKIKNKFNDPFYNLPVRHFDHQKSKAGKIFFNYNTFKRKRTHPKIGVHRGPRESREKDFESIQNHSKAVPAPWNYELGLKWMKGPNAKENYQKINRDRKKLLKKWKGKNAKLVDEVEEKMKANIKKENKLEMDVRNFEFK